MPMISPTSRSRRVISALEAQRGLAPATQFVLVLVIVIGVSHRGVALAIRLRVRAPLC